LVGSASARALNSPTGTLHCFFPSIIRSKVLDGTPPLVLNFDIASNSLDYLVKSGTPLQQQLLTVLTREHEI
jgi:hypothetical protein